MAGNDLVVSQVKDQLSQDERSIVDAYLRDIPVLLIVRKGPVWETDIHPPVGLRTTQYQYNGPPLWAPMPFSIRPCEPNFRSSASINAVKHDLQEMAATRSQNRQAIAPE
jgi:hypothetical protein